MKNFLLKNGDAVWVLVEILLAILFFIFSNGVAPNFLIGGGVFLGMSLCDLFDFKIQKGGNKE